MGEDMSIIDMLQAIQDPGLYAKLNTRISELLAEVERLKKEERGLRLDRYNLTQRAEAAEAEVKRLKCCGNCASCRENGPRCGTADFMHVKEAEEAGWDNIVDFSDIRVPEDPEWPDRMADPKVSLGDRCHFTPSRWERRES